MSPLGRTPSRPPRALPLALVLLALSALGLVVGAPRAAAHEGEAVITVESAVPTAAGTTVAYVVRVTWANDGHAALDSTVTATVVAADGSTRTPVPLDPLDEDGRYGATVTFPAPGTWTVRFTSITPPGVLEQAEDVGSPPATGPEATTAPATPTTAPATPTTVPVATSALPAETTTVTEGLVETPADGEDDGTTWWPFAAGTVALVAIAAGVVAMRRRT